jgi:hypothetical protein
MKEKWDDFVRASKNGTFLFFRDYMEYHAERYLDNSLIVLDDKEQIVALLPANKNADAILSHGGLTYGGFITDARMRTALMLEVFDCVLARLRADNFARFVYKCVPHIYHQCSAEEDGYALFRAGAHLVRRDVSCTIQRDFRQPYQERRRRAIKKAAARGVVCRESNDYAAYWRILEENLASSHNAKPVHSLAEIERLRGLFPNNIKLFAAFAGDEMIGGTVIYETPTVAHAQYIASSEHGRAVGGLDLLFDYLLTEVFSDKPYFDFGISTEQSGKFLNKGLIEFKEGFGGRAVNYDFFEIALV